MILCSSGLFISYKLSLHNIHLRQREIILHSDIFKNRVVHFTFPRNHQTQQDNDLVFVEDDEIMFNGKMYDIIEQLQTNDSVFIKCIPDKIEDDIRAEASNQLDKNDGANTQKNFSGFKFNAGPFIVVTEVTHYFNFLKTATELFPVENPEKLVAAFLNIPSPPPWSV